MSPRTCVPVCSPTSVIEMSPRLFRNCIFHAPATRPAAVVVDCMVVATREYAILIATPSPALCGTWAALGHIAKITDAT